MPFQEKNVRKLVASMLMALDGVVENPQMWTVQFRSEESQHYKFDELFASDALLLGRRTYQDFAAAWPGATGAYGERINTMPKYVPTTTLQEAECHLHQGQCWRGSDQIETGAWSGHLDLWER